MLFPIGDRKANDLILFIQPFISQEPVFLVIVQLLKSLSFGMDTQNPG